MNELIVPACEILLHRHGADKHYRLFPSVFDFKALDEDVLIRIHRQTVCEIDVAVTLFEKELGCFTIFLVSARMRHSGKHRNSGIGLMSHTAEARSKRAVLPTDHDRRAAFIGITMRGEFKRRALRIESDGIMAFFSARDTVIYAFSAAIHVAYIQNAAIIGKCFAEPDVFKIARLVEIDCIGDFAIFQNIYAVLRFVKHDVISP